jgi:agmatinase
MKNSFFVAVLSSLVALPVVCMAQDDTAVDAEAAIIRLDPNAEGLDVWSQLRDTSNDAEREPGLVPTGRLRRPGVLSFFSLPLAFTPEDLKAANVDVAIMGAPLDMGFRMRGARQGPTALRASIGVSRGSGNLPHMHVGVAWKKELVAVDYGDAPLDGLSTERSMPPVRKLVREIAETGAIPIIIGGDHSLEYPNVAAVADVYGKANVGVIHFDAHFDAGDSFSGHLISHGQPIRRLIDDGHILGKNYIQVGLRGYWPGEDGFNWMRENEMRYHTMAEIERYGWDAVMERVLDEANDGPEYLYISFDIDVFDPAYMPGTGTPESGGLTPREVFPLVRTLCSENNLVGFDLVELNPLVDPGYTTVLNSNMLVQECLTGIAMRKTGVTERAYLNPLTVGDDQDDP